jgi:hypothetical protein
MVRMLSRALVVGLAAVPAGCSIDVRGDEIVVREERRFTVAGDLELALTTFDGAIEVRSWDRPEVLVEIERRAASGAEAQALEVRTSQEGNRLIVDAPNVRRTREDDVIQIGGRQSPSVSLRVTAPARLTLEARTGDGPLAARDLVGRLTLRTADGPVNTDRLTGDVTINTGDGPVVARDTRGTLDLHTGDGAVDASGRLETLRVRTGDGPIRVDAHEGSVMKGEWTVETGDGAITVRLPGAFSAEVDAFSGDGRITIAGVGNATSSDDNDQPAQIRTRLGSGGSTLRLRTGDGPIRVDR